MLQTIRDKITGYLAFFVIILITIPFSLWGIDFYLTGSSNPEVAEVGSKEITKSELDSAYDRQLQQLRRLMGDNFDQDRIDPPSFRRDVLNSMIQQAALDDYIDSESLAVDNASVSDYIRSLPTFQVDGQFSQDTYLALLAQQGISPQAFEEDVRASLALDQLRGAILESSFLSDAVIGNTYRLLRQQRGLDYLRVDAQQLAASVTPTEEEINQRYERDSASYSLPERVRLSYVLLDKSAYEPEPTPEPEMLEDMYATEKAARFSKPEQRTPRHILIRVDDDTSEEQAREKLENIASQLAGGAEFSDLAKQDSEDPGSKDEGGLLDPVTRGMLDPAFEDALFAMEEGEVSPPVRTDFGWHLIRLEAVTPSSVLPLDDPTVQEELLNLYQVKMRDERFRQDSARLGELAYESDNSLKPVSETLGLEIQTTDWVTRGSGSGIAEQDAVRRTAFSEELLEQGYNSEVLELDSSRKLVVRVAEYEEARVRPLDEVRDEIVAALKQEAGRKQAREKGQALLEKLKSGESLSAVASGPRVSMKSPGLIGRDSDALEAAALQVLFEMPRPADGKNSYAGAALSDGDFVVMALNRVEDAKLDEAPESERQSTARNLRDRIAGAEFQAFVSALREELDVEIHEDRL